MQCGTLWVVTICGTVEWAKDTSTTLRNCSADKDESGGKIQNEGTQCDSSHYIAVLSRILYFPSPAIGSAVCALPARLRC